MGIFNRNKPPGHQADRLADKAEKLAAHVRTGRTNAKDGANEMKKIQAELKGMDHAGPARSRVRAAADEVFNIRNAQVPDNVNTARHLITTLAATNTTSHPGPTVKTVRGHFNSLWLGPHRNELKGELDAVADELFTQYRRHSKAQQKVRDREHQQRSRDAKARLQDALSRKEDQARRLADRARKLASAENDLDRRRRDYQSHLSRLYGLYGKQPLRRNHNQRSLEDKVVGLEHRIADIRKTRREVESKQRDVDRSIRDIRSKLRSWK